ncbi:MAG: RDD family protein [Sphingobacteriaceae bacterium]
MKSYLVVIAGKPEGPFTSEKLQSLDIKPDTFVKTESMADYKEAQEVPELRNLFGFKVETVLPQYFATLDTRLLAIAIDYFLVFGAYCVLALLAMSFVAEQNIKLEIAVAGIIIIPVVRSIYATAMEASARQASLGKQWLGIKVCDEAGNRISFAKSLSRNLFKWISTLTLGIGYLMGFFDKKQQCLHDKMAGTMVVKDRLL